MILVDANLLVYAFASDISEHEGAVTWLEDVLAGPGRVGLPWPSLIAFVRLVTNPRVFSHPASPREAIRQVSSWLAATSSWTPGPTRHHGEIFEGLVSKYDLYADLIPDAHLAALAIEHGLTMFSTDGDFARFEELRWVNPLAAS